MAILLMEWTTATKIPANIQKKREILNIVTDTNVKENDRDSQWTSGHQPSTVKLENWNKIHSQNMITKYMSGCAIVTYS